MNQPYDWKSLERHPLSAEYKDLTGWAWEDFLEGLKEHGIVNERRVTLYQGMILDGWQLQRACVELNRRPLYQELPEGISPEDYVAAQNEYRRHESEEALKARRKKRIERVAQARAQGQTFSQIAEQAGVGESTVRRDAQESQEGGQAGGQADGQEGAQEAPQTVTGKDGKTYAASKPKKERILCNRCQKTPVKGCIYCRDMNRKKKKGQGKKAGRPKKGQEVKEVEEDGPKDCFGTLVPKRCRDRLQDPWAQESIDFLASWSTKFRDQRLASGMNKRRKQLPFFNAQDFIDGVGFIGTYLDKLLDHLKDFRVEAVCPVCEGAGCEHCHQAGLVPRKLHPKLKKKMKEAAKETKKEQGQEQEARGVGREEGGQ
jgi:hypothetical protein